MTNREMIINVLEGKKPSVIPSFNEVPMDVTVVKALMPEDSGDGVKDLVSHAEFFKNSAISAMGIGVPVKTISKDDKHHRYRYETGAVWREEYDPTFCREAESFTINSPEDAINYTMIDANDPDRLDQKAAVKTSAALKDLGYFVQGSVMGVWMGIYYYLTSFDNILMWMAIEKEAARALFAMTRRYSIESAKRLLACGVDCIFTASDLGSGNSLLFSKEMFREYVLPWLKELADLCHNHGAYLHLHSHGHIEKLMDDIVGAGVDMINPVGPSDHNDLAMFKEKWGDKITFMGGIGTAISTMSENEIKEHVQKVVKTGRKNGRFFPRTESGIPPMSTEKTMFYLKVLQEECSKGYE